MFQPIGKRLQIAIVGLAGSMPAQQIFKQDLERAGQAFHSRKVCSGARQAEVLVGLVPDDQRRAGV